MSSQEKIVCLKATRKYNKYSLRFTTCIPNLAKEDRLYEDIAIEHIVSNILRYGDMLEYNISYPDDFNYHEDAVRIHLPKFYAQADVWDDIQLHYKESELDWYEIRIFCPDSFYFLAEIDYVEGGLYENIDTIKTLYFYDSVPIKIFYKKVRAVN